MRHTRVMLSFECCPQLLQTMQKPNYQQQLKAAEEYCKTLQDNFNNNLQVIEERELEVQTLADQLAHLQNHNQTLIATLDHQHSENDLQIRLIRNEFTRKLEQKEGEMEELAAMVESKMRKQMELVRERLQQEAKSARSQAADRDETNRRLLHENSRLAEVIRDQKSSLLELEGHVASLNEERNAMSSKMALHEQELEGIRSCNSSWEDMLKEKLKEAQRERQSVEEEYGDYKLTVKEKLRRQKEDLGKRILQLSEEREAQVREASQEAKELRFKLEKALGVQREREKEVQLLREERGKLEAALSKYKEQELRTSFEKNQKEYDYLLKIFEQDKRDLKSQIDLVVQEKKEVKQELDEANLRRESTEKAVERLRTDLLNKSKDFDELKKEHKRMKCELEVRLKEAEANCLQLQGQQNRQAGNSKGFEIVESARMENDYSKAFTDDMGFIDEKFLMGNSASRSPKNKNGFNFNNGNGNHREAGLMKRVSELQLEVQEYKNLIKRQREEEESFKKICEEERSREVSLYRDKANIYWEKANDKQQQVMLLREQYNEIKASYVEVNAELKRYREKQGQSAKKEEELEQLKRRVSKMEEEKRQLEEEIGVITKERDLMEEISSQLRSENHSLREIINHSHIDNYSQSNLLRHNHTIEEQNHTVEQSKQETIQLNQLQVQPQHQRPRIPTKLHDLVRQKHMLSISGKRAPIEERTTEVRLEHIGTDSQKEVLEQIKVKNKTPPKIANYAEMKKDKQRRSQQMQTLSQKQVYQRLRSRQNIQPPPSPERGINYLYLRQLQEGH